MDVVMPEREYLRALDILATSAYGQALVRAVYFNDGYFPSLALDDVNPNHFRRGKNVLDKLGWIFGIFNYIYTFTYHLLGLLYSAAPFTYRQPDIALSHDEGQFIVTFLHQTMAHPSTRQTLEQGDVTHLIRAELNAHLSTSDVEDIRTSRV